MLYEMLRGRFFVNTNGSPVTEMAMRFSDCFRKILVYKIVA